MALVTGALGIATVVLLVAVGRHHLYLLIVLRRWPDENDVRIRRREMEDRRERRRATTVRARRRLRPAGHAPAASVRSVAALAMATSVLLTAGFTAALTSSDRPPELQGVERDPASAPAEPAGVVDVVTAESGSDVEAPPLLGREIPPASSTRVEGASTGAATGVVYAPG